VSTISSKRNRSDGGFWQADAGIIAQGRKAFHRHKSGMPHNPIIILFAPNRPNKADDGDRAGEEVDGLRAALDLTIETRDRVD
jgi:hypothetical protein